MIPRCHERNVQYFFDALQLFNIENVGKLYPKLYPKLVLILATPPLWIKNAVSRESTRVQCDVHAGGLAATCPCRPMTLGNILNDVSALQMDDTTPNDVNSVDVKINDNNTLII